MDLDSTDILCIPTHIHIHINTNTNTNIPTAGTEVFPPSSVVMLSRMLPLPP